MAVLEHAGHYVQTAQSVPIFPGSLKEKFLGAICHPLRDAAVGESDISL